MLQELSGKIAEAAICYTGDILDDTRAKYTFLITKKWRKN